MSLSELLTYTASDDFSFATYSGSTSGLTMPDKFLHPYIISGSMSNSGFVSIYFDSGRIFRFEGHLVGIIFID